jgi:hypothetical protein
VKAVVTLVCAGALLVACGGDPALSDDAATFLQAQVRNARQAAANGDVTGAIDQLNAAADVLTRFHDDGSVSDGRADDIRAAIDDARAALESSATTTSSTETTEPTDDTDTTESTESTEPPTTIAPSTEPSTTTTTFVDEGDNNKGDGKGKGKGDKGGDG